MTKLSKILSIVLGLIILGAIAALIYVIAVPAPEDSFTEFYILGPGGEAAGYPVQLKAGEEGSVILVIVNREYEPMSYRVEIKMDGVTTDILEPIALEHGGRYEQSVTFTPNEPGAKSSPEPRPSRLSGKRPSTPASRGFRSRRSESRAKEIPPPSGLTRDVTAE